MSEKCENYPWRELYNGLKDFLDVATTREFYRPLDKVRVSRIIKEILEVK